MIDRLARLWRSNRMEQATAAADAASFPTSMGPVELAAGEQALLARLQAGIASMEEGQAFYQALTARGAPFPVEWELAVLRVTVRALPEREDLRARLDTLERQLRDTARVAEADDVQPGWERAWAHFARGMQPAAGDAQAAAQARDACFHDACVLLSSPWFATLPVARRTEVILALHDTLMAAPSPDLVVVAELGLRQFARMLDDPGLPVPAMLALHDALHGMYFSGVSDVRDLRRFDAIVPSIERRLLALRPHPRPARAVDPRGELGIAYLLHTAHLDQGNAVSPLVLSLAQSHATRSGRRVFLYLVQYVGPAFVSAIEGQGFQVRAFHQDRAYARLDDIEQSLRADGIDVVVSEQNRAVATALFARRVAPLQLWADTGFPFWNIESLDWTLFPAMAGAADPVRRASPLRWRQPAETLRHPVDPAEVAAVRAGFPPGAFVLGVFARLVKLNEQVLALLQSLLADDPRCHLFIAGTGDAAHVHAFAARPGLAGRVTFVHRNVDLNVHGQAVDVMCDTFPFIGGNACREVAAQGTPVVSMLGTPWDDLLRRDRSVALLARDAAQYRAHVARLRDDGAFRRQQREAALHLFDEQVDPGVMLDDVEAAIAAAAQAGPRDVAGSGTIGAG
jgi:glycosyltransferase involved in cell wall biosynthesis